MQSMSCPERLQSAVRARPVRRLNSKLAGVDVHVVWRGDPKYLAECIEEVAQVFDFHIAGISAEWRVIFSDDDGTMHTRSLRRIRLRYAGSSELFCSGLMAVLEEIERVCPWLHVTRIEKSARAVGPFVA